MWSQMTKSRSGHLKTLQRHAHLDGRLSSITKETKQVTGIGKCQARKAKAQRKHIITAILAWIVLKAQAYAKNMTI